MGKDWSGNNKSAYTRIGASNHSLDDRESNDFYATDPKTIDYLFSAEEFSENIWEPSVGMGHLSNRMKELGKRVVESDLIDRGCGTGGIDFLKCGKLWKGDIITNPPYILAEEFVRKALDLIPEGNKVAMFLKLTFMEGQKRKKLFEEHPFKRIGVFSFRANCAKNGDFEKYPSSAIAYAWYIWEKGFKGSPSIFWF